MDVWEIINARRQAHLSDNSDRFPALNSIFDNVQYPKDFKPTNIQKYNGKQDSAQWLHLYSTANNVAGGDIATKVLYFPMALEPAPLTWLESLTCEFIHSWEDLKKVFIDNFQGSLHRVATRHALAMCKQEQGKTIRSYVKRFFDTRATIPNVADNDVIDYFQSGITVQSLYRDFGRNRPKTVVDLRDMMQRWQMKRSKNAVAFPVATATTTGCAIMIVEGPATSRILRVSVSLTTLSVLWIAHRPVRRATSRRISSTRSSTTKDVQSTPRATTRCVSA